jgi:hypothetical protein
MNTPCLPVPNRLALSSPYALLNKGDLNAFTVGEAGKVIEEEDEEAEVFAEVFPPINPSSP